MGVERKKERGVCNKPGDKDNQIFSSILGVVNFVYSFSEGVREGISVI